MCEFKNKSLLKTVTGYKIVLTVNEQLYSPFTGIEYKIGPVTPTNSYGKYNLTDALDWCRALNKNNFWHRKKYFGRTAVF